MLSDLSLPYQNLLWRFHRSITLIFLLVCGSPSFSEIAIFSILSLINHQQIVTRYYRPFAFYPPFNPIYSCVHNLDTGKCCTAITNIKAATRNGINVGCFLSPSIPLSYNQNFSGMSAILKHFR